jgi:hypothetical protein
MGNDDLGDTKFDVEIITSDKYFAGTKAKVSLWITDITGKTVGPVELDGNQNGKPVFDRNSDIFSELEFSGKRGKIRKRF